MLRELRGECLAGEGIAINTDVTTVCGCSGPAGPFPTSADVVGYCFRHDQGWTRRPSLDNEVSVA